MYGLTMSLYQASAYPIVLTGAICMTASALFALRFGSRYALLSQSVFSLSFFVPLLLSV